MALAFNINIDPLYKAFLVGLQTCDHPAAWHDIEIDGNTYTLLLTTPDAAREMTKGHTPDPRSTDGEDDV